MSDKNKQLEQLSATQDEVVILATQRSGKVAQVVKAAPDATVNRWSGFAQIIASKGVTVPQRSKGEQKTPFMLYRLSNGSPEFKGEKRKEQAQAAAKGINALLRKAGVQHSEVRAMQSAGGWVVAAFRKGIRDSTRTAYPSSLWEGGEA